eukprot:CAMPEP_0116012322 /NCGR_PEP_ID=MMETSP0321-20121206/5059_1 /TAXON_ID=163516 /ORGANISM="Leptocylindrus danicus var. danicus, Strain B650" /LENGTH=344 /DNA_ID=CAMNT_0003481653 /DNA_START=146 /DNA_END=1180 /DNA_ORIENTATION=-
MCAVCNDDNNKNEQQDSQHTHIIGGRSTTLCEATVDIDVDIDIAPFEMEGGDEDWSDLGPDKETDCELCIGFRQGPCGNYWRRQEMCMDKYKDYVDDKDKQDTATSSTDEDEKLGRADKNDDSGNDGKSEEGKTELPNWAKPCEKPFIAWNRCLQKHTEWYDDYFQGQKAEAAAAEAKGYNDDDDDDDDDDDEIVEESASKVNDTDNRKQDRDDSLPDPSDESREAWEKRLRLLEKTVTETMGESIPFPSGDFLTKPSLSINTSAATGMVIFPMSIDGGDIIIGYVRDHNGQLLGVGRKDELDAVELKGALEFGGINGFTKYVYIYALYEGAEKPMYVHKVDLA